MQIKINVNFFLKEEFAFINHIFTDRKCTFDRDVYSIASSWAETDSWSYKIVHIIVSRILQI